MRIIVSLLLASYFFINPSLANDKKVSFDAQAALSYIKDLASDAMMGRKSGQPGGALAEEYVASRFREWGVEPGGENGTYFQELTIEHMNIEPGVALEIITDRGRRTFSYNEYFRIGENGWKAWRFSGSGHFTEKIVFVGYGISDPDKGYDDFSGVDLEGKIALMIFHIPRSFADKYPRAADINARIRAVQAHGARAVLICPSPSAAGRVVPGWLDKQVYKKDFVMLRIQGDVTDYIFKNLKTEIRYLISEMDGKQKPQSFDTRVRAFVSVNAVFDERRKTRNVLGKISGTDDKLKNECVIIGAHLDHIGINPIGEVMNGANDNASGSAVAMEIARIIRLGEPKPKRSIVFFLWAAEEQHNYAGLVHYVTHPIIPLEKTVAYINMDMVGHGNGKIRFGPIQTNHELWSLIEKKLPHRILAYIDKFLQGNRIYERRTGFPPRGVPRFGMATQGYHFKYHHSRDDPDLILPELLKKTGDFVRGMAEIMANEPSNLIPPNRKEVLYSRHLVIPNHRILSFNEIEQIDVQSSESIVDLQLTIIEPSHGLSEDSRRIDLINKAFDVSEEINSSQSLVPFINSFRVNSDARQGKTSLLLGFKGLEDFSHDPRWLEVLSDRGIKFVLIDNPSFLFEREKLTESGEKTLKALADNSILPIFLELSELQIKILFMQQREPVVLIRSELPDSDINNLIKESRSVLGLKIAQEESIAAYFKKLDQCIEILGSKHLAIVNDQCLWSEEGKQQILDLLSEMFRTEYDRIEIMDVFSSSFLGILDRIRR